MESSLNKIADAAIMVLYLYYVTLYWMSLFVDQEDEQLVQTIA